jgi:hypothetical protein
MSTGTSPLSLSRPGAIYGLVAAVVTTGIVILARAADIPVAVSDEPIPLLGFGQLTLVGAAIGVALARVVLRYSPHPRRAFTTGTVLLTAISLVPDAVVDASAASRAILMLTHIAAAAIIIPPLAARLDARQTAQRPSGATSP